MTLALHLGDCLEVLRTMPDASVDAVVTDPPYYRVKDEDGATGQACLALGREFIGIERCPHWHRVGTQSLKAVQPDLFAEMAA